MSKEVDEAEAFELETPTGVYEKAKITAICALAMWKPSPAMIEVTAQAICDGYLAATAAERARSKAKVQQFYTIAYEALNIAGGLTNYVEPRPALTNAERAIERLQKELYALAAIREGETDEGENLCYGPSEIEYEHEEGHDYVRGYLCPRCGLYDFDRPIPTPHRKESHHDQKHDVPGDEGGGGER
jgi:hypothetical protein